MRKIVNLLCLSVIGNLFLFLKIKNDHFYNKLIAITGIGQPFMQLDRQVPNDFNIFPRKISKINIKFTK